MTPSSPRPEGTHLARVFSVVLIVLSLVILAGYWASRMASYRKVEEATLVDMEHRAAALTGAVAEQTRSVVYNLDLVLRHLQQVAVRTGKLDDEDIQDVLAATPPGLVRRVTVIDAAGYVSHAYPPLPSPSANLADRPHFQAHVGTADNMLYIGHPIQSRFTQEWLIPLSRRLQDARGSFTGVATLNVAPEYFAEIYSRLADGREDVVALVSQDGMFLSRSLNLLNYMGKSVRSDRPFIADTAHRAGVFRGVSSYEPVDRVFAWRRLEEWPLVVIIGLGVSETLAPIQANRDRDLAARSAVSLLVLALVAGVSLVLSRLSRNVVHLSETKERLSMALSGAAELAWDWDLRRNQLAFFGDCQALFGQDAREVRLSMDEWTRRAHPDDREAVARRVQQALRQHAGDVEFVLRLQHADQSWRWMLVRGRTVQRGARGRIERMIGILLDVDASRRAELLAAQTRESYAQLIENAGEGIFVVDRDGRIEIFNPAAARLLGIGAEQAHGQLASSLIAELPERPAPECPVTRTLADGRARRGERLSYRRQDGRALPVELSVAPTTVDGKPAGAVVVFADISERLAWEAELESLARTDTLTGVANRRHFVEQCEHELLRSDREGTPLTLMMLDVDHFKQINDQHGHAAGDAMLKAVAATCSRAMRQIDVFGRLGGEEFGAALPGVGLAEALAVAARLRECVAAEVVTANGHEIRCTASIGVALRQPGEGFDSLLARADRLMYAAKAAGRNVVVADELPSAEGAPERGEAIIEGSTGAG